MIQNITITGINYEVDDNTKKYAVKHIGRLDRFLPRHAKKSVIAKVTIRQVNKSHGNKYEMDALLKLPGNDIAAKDEAGNVIALVDILEAKLTPQIRKYKMEALPHTGKKSLWAKLKRR